MIARRRRQRFGVVTAGLMLALFAGQATAAGIDPVASQIGFTLKTRWGQSLLGVFPDPRGEILDLPDGRHRVHLQLATARVEIVDHPSYTRYTRGSGFFDVEDYPRIEFHSDAYSPELLRTGGSLPGLLTIRNMTHREVFTISPSSCATPARDCDVVATGTIRRSHYGMDRWDLAVSDQVRFILRVRVHGSDA